MARSHCLLLLLVLGIGAGCERKPATEPVDDDSGMDVPSLVPLTELEGPGLLELDGDFSFDLSSEDIALTDVETETATPKLGLWFQDVDALESVLLAEGVRVHAVAPGGPGDLGGVRVGDLVTHLNEQPMKSSAALRRSIGQLAVGEEGKLGILRNGERRSISLVAIDWSTYPERDTWQPWLPTFDAARETESMFDAHEDEMEALKGILDGFEAADEFGFDEGATTSATAMRRFIEQDVITIQRLYANLGKPRSLGDFGPPIGACLTYPASDTAAIYTVSIHFDGDPRSVRNATIAAIHKVASMRDVELLWGTPQTVENPEDLDEGVIEADPFK